MEYFWRTYHTLPDGVGFSRFGVEHLTALALVVAGIVACYNVMGGWWRVGFALGALAVILLMIALGQRLSKRAGRTKAGGDTVPGDA